MPRQIIVIFQKTFLILVRTRYQGNLKFLNKNYQRNYITEETSNYQATLANIMLESAYYLSLLIHSAVSDILRMVICGQIGLHYT